MSRRVALVGAIASLGCSGGATQRTTGQTTGAAGAGYGAGTGAGGARIDPGTGSGGVTIITTGASTASGSGGGTGCAGGCEADADVDAGPPAVCGDGVISGTEQCDDGNMKSGDGCSNACWLEQGYACETQTGTPASVCHATTCGDGTKEGFEQCDDGNLVPYDGCSPTCTVEPKCNGTGGCTGVCGDGLVFPNEACDDGNTVSGDGCSATCEIEPGIGYACVNVAEDPPDSLDLPILYRDMLYANTTSFPSPRPTGGGHPDFNVDAYNIGQVTGLAAYDLGADSEPVFGSIGSPQVLTGAVPFCWWFHEKGCDGASSTNPYAKLVYLNASGKPTTLHLAETAVGSNKYTYSNDAFFPLDGLGWNAGTNPQTDVALDGTSGHNFSFTSEVHYVFTYQKAASNAAAPVFHFSGDDDVWVFINGQLVVDLGGQHSPITADIALTPANSKLLGLVDGGWYSIDLFQAERHVKGSDYALELSGFEHTVTKCKPACGDGLLARAAGEQCDLGKANVEATSTTYGPGICTTSCTWAPYCGDGLIQSEFGEACDGGDDCDDKCQIIPPH